MRSKAHWGYDDAFMEACREELSVTEEELGATNIRVLDNSGQPVGIIRLLIENSQLHLSKLFVDPSMIGTGAGRILYGWAVAQARALGWDNMLIDSDPDASEFYQHMGAKIIGKAPSGSIPGRFIPLLRHDL